MHIVCWKGKERKRLLGRGETGREGKGRKTSGQPTCKPTTKYIVPKEWGEGRTEKKLPLWYILDAQ